MSGVNIFKKFGTDLKKETEGVPFYLDPQNEAYILVARYTNRNKDFSRENAEIVKSTVGASEEEKEAQLTTSFAKHLVKGWKGVLDENGDEIPFTLENADRLLQDLPELFEALLNFSLNRNNYGIDSVEKVAKN